MLSKACIQASWPIRKPCRLALIGEAPGAREEQEGWPFVGRAGKLLDKWLAKAGINLDYCLITNCFFQRPHKNKIAEFFVTVRIRREQGIEVVAKLGTGPHGYLMAEHADEIGRLSGELLRWAPQVIVPLGSTALWLLTGKSEIGKWHGQEMGNRIYAPAPAIPTYHPSHILRGQWDKELDAIDDLRHAWKTATSK